MPRGKIPKIACKRTVTGQYSGELYAKNTEGAIPKL